MDLSKKTKNADKFDEALKNKNLNNLNSNKENEEKTGDETKNLNNEENGKDLEEKNIINDEKKK